METYEKETGQKGEGRKQMEDRNQRLERTISEFGWGLFLILVGTLFFAGNKSWLDWDKGWLYFVIGLGAIYIIGFLVRYFGGHTNRWSVFGGLGIGLALIYIGIAFIYGFGDWWPLALIPIGTGYLVKGIRQNGSGSYLS